MKTKSKSMREVPYIRWVARILGTLSVALFLLLFIPDVIRKGGMPNTDFIHGLLTFLFIIGLIGLLIAWRWEGIGGLLAIIGFVSTTLMNVIWVQAGKDPGSEIVFLIPALLFIYCWWRTRRQPQQNSTDG